MIVRVIKDVTCTIHAGQTVDIKDSDVDMLKRWGFIEEVKEPKVTKKAKKQSK